MPRTIYVLMGGHGEYSDRQECPVLAFESGAAANELCAKLMALAKARNLRANDGLRVRWDSEARRAAHAFADAGARELGFQDGMPADDFCVVAVELR